MITPTLCRGGFETLPRIQPLSLILLSLLLFTMFPALAQDDSTVLYPGTYQAEDGRIIRSEGTQIIEAEGAEFGNAIQLENSGILSEVRITTSGTEVVLRMKGDRQAAIFVEIDGIQFDYNTHHDQLLRTWGTWGQWTIQNSFLTETHHYVFKVGTENGIQGGVLIDTITVVDRTFQNVAPLAAGVLIFAGVFAYVVVSSLRTRWAK
jgi:hypothetical protein